MDEFVNSTIEELEPTKGEYELFHIGVARRSGRYPWGSGADPYQRSMDFLAHVDSLHKQGLSDKQIADGLGITTTQLRAYKAIDKNIKRKAQESEAIRLKEDGYSNVAIGERMGIAESSVRALLNPVNQEKTDKLVATADLLKAQVDEKGYLDVGAGVENHVGVSQTSLATAVTMLKEQGYEVHNIKIEQLGTGKFTEIKVLAPPSDLDRKEVFKDIVTNPDKVKSITGYSEDDGRTFLGIEPPTSVDLKRVGVRYAEDGGADMDGVIQLRRGLDDTSLGEARYAQVRIKVGDGHYLKGMAVYSDNLPDGVDFMFNTNKKNTGNKLDAMKGLKDDEDNPFGSVVRQKHYIDKDGKKRLSPLNIVGTEDPDGLKTPGEEGGWSAWSSKLSSQMLSKQTPALAKEQLGLTYDIKKSEYDEIMSLTNPTIKKQLLNSFADSADSSAVHLKAAALPRTSNHVILPINTLKDNEIYAPNYRPGERVVLIRYPHGGKFEIPELVVTDKNPEARSVMRNAKDAVGINSRVAARLSGADFDGDTVLVIPNNHQKVKTESPLEGLKDFDPQTTYKPYDGMRTIDGGTYSAKTGKVDYGNKKPNSRAKQTQMGEVSNLITDMTIRGATNAELARAVKHSMVVIDAEKHKLNYRQSALDNQIRDLKSKYQRSARGGATTLVSQASSAVNVPDRVARKAKDGGPIDPATGKRMYESTGASYVNRQGKTIQKTVKSTRMAEADDAFSLSSGRPIEAVYATHANKLKSLANNARKEAYTIKGRPYSPSAKKTYAREVDSLDAKLNVALKNQPRERQAQLIGNSVVKAKRQANPNLDQSEIKKIKSQALATARARADARKQRIEITDREWEAIQSGAITNNKLERILANTDLDKIKQRAMPRAATVMSPAKMARAKAMLASGYTQADIADALGVPTSTLNTAVNR